MFKLYVKNMTELIKKLLEVFLPGLVIFFAPVSGIVISICVLVILDTILGIIAAKKGKQEITSRKLSRIVSKSLLYISLLYMVFPIDYFLLNELTLMLISVPYFFTKMVGVTLAIIEIKSIHENIITFSGINLFQTLKELLLRAKDIKEDIDELKP